MGYTLKVIEPYQGIKNYINAVLTNESRDMNQLWIKYAVEPFWKDWAEGQFNEQRIREGISRPVKEVVKLRKSIDVPCGGTIFIISRETNFRTS